MNLRGRLLVVISLGGLLPLLATLWAIGAWVSHQLDHDADEQLIGRARIAARHVDQHVGVLLDLARTNSRIPPLTLALQGEKNLGEVQRVLSRMMFQDVINTVSCALLDANARVLADTQPQNVGIDESQAAYVSVGSRSLVPEMTGPAIPPGQQRQFIHVIAAITNAEQKILGYLRCRYEPALLQAVLHQDERRSGTGVRLALVDEQRVVLGGPRDLAARGTTWLNPVPSDKSQISWTGDGTHRYAEAPLDGHPWRVIALRERAEHQTASRSLILVLAIVAVSAIWLILAAAAIASGLLTRPIKALSQSVAAIDPEHPPAALSAVSGDEDLDALGGRFSALLARVQTLLAERQTRLRELESTTAALQASEAFHRGLFASSPNGLAVLDGDRVSDCNAKLLRLFGCTREQLNELSPLRRVPERQPDGRSSSVMMDEILTRVRTSEEAQIRCTLMRQDGSCFDADLNLVRLLLPQRTVIMLVLRDISEQLELENRLRQAHKMEAVGQLAGGVAHDFNNMLAGIIGSADLLRNRLPANDERTQRLVSTILTAGERAAGLARQLLTFSRQSRSVSTPVDLHQVINDAVELISRSIDRRITITTTLSANPSHVMGDPSQLQNAVLNLCLNARDAMPNGGRLDLKTDVMPLERGFAAHLGFDLEAGNYLRLSVIDNGIGMTPDILARVFEPFFTTKEVGHGTGLGLSVVWGTIKEHHGAIIVSSQPGSGTTFHLYLPLVGRDSPDLTPRETPVVQGRGRILVIDDEELVRSATTLLLEDLGYQVVSVADGQSGLDLFTAEHDRLTAVLLDVVMPRMGGRDAFLAMHAIDPAVPIIMSSGFTRDVAVRDLREQGLFAFIAKPFRKQELAELMARAAASRTMPT